MIVGGQGVVVRIVTRLWTGKSWALFLAGTRDFYFHPNVHTGSGANAAFCEIGIGGSLFIGKPAES